MAFSYNNIIIIIVGEVLDTLPQLLVVIEAIVGRSPETETEEVLPLVIPSTLISYMCTIYTVHVRVSVSIACSVGWTRCLAMTTAHVFLKQSTDSDS